MSVTFELLGEVRAYVEGRALHLGHSRQRSVLVALLVEPNRPQPLDSLAERVWGDRPPRQARSALYSYLHRLRQVFADVPGVRIDRTPGGYLLPVEEEAVDLHRFLGLVQRSRTADDETALVLLEQALELWHGRPLGGVEGTWAESVRRTLAQQRWTALLHRNDLALRAGRHAALVAELSVLVNEDPLDERLVGQLLLALYRCGRQADALHLYQQTRLQLAEELGADPSPALRELHQRVLTADAALSVTAAPSPVSLPVPRQLPAAPPHFTGRSAELAALTASLDGDAPMLSVIAGAGGTGKSWLALSWAHRHADRFPDGHLFVDLQGFSPTAAPMDPATAVRGFLDALGADSRSVPADLHAQSALFRSLMADKRMLVVIDNARDADQVVPLLPGTSTCAVIVTSRNRLIELLARHGARLIAVHSLDADEAEQVLVTRLGAERLAAEPEAVERLLHCCQGFPLALGIVAARAAAHVEFPLESMAAELHDAATRLDALADDNPAASLPAVLSCSHNALTPRQAKVFALLGMAVKHDIDLHAASALTGLPVAVTRRVLRALEDVHLVRRHVSDRWLMHDLIGLYAADRARHDLVEAERETAQRRLVDFYLQTAHAAERLLNPHRDPIRIGAPSADCHPWEPADHAAAMGWMASEHPNLMAAQRTAVDREWHTAVWQLAWTMDAFHSRRGRLHDKVTVWRAGLAAAEQHDDPALHALAHRALGAAAAYAESGDEALRHLARALALAERIGDRNAQAHVHRALAWAWERQGRHRRALEHATRALALFRELELPEWEAAALNAVGWHEAQLGEDYERARASCEAALDLARRRGHRQVEAVTHDSLGLIARLTGRYAEAVDHHRMAVGLCRDLGHTYDEAEAFEGLGHAHQSLAEQEQARMAWQQSLQLYRAQHRLRDAERVVAQLDALGRAE